jgi:hypothetical protein
MSAEDRKYVITLEFDAEEFSVLTTALGHLRGYQIEGRKKQTLTADETDYIAATDRVLRKICRVAGLPENFADDVCVRAQRERMGLAPKEGA